MRIEYLTQKQIKSLIKLLEEYKNTNEYKQIYLLLNEMRTNKNE